jgi:putative transposase
MLEQNGEWAISRRYMSLESLAPVSDSPMIRLPGVAATSVGSWCAAARH